MPISEPPTSSSPRPGPSGERVDYGVTAPLPRSDAALFEAFVAPHYLVPFAELALSLLTPPAYAGDAVVAHIGCRTGFPEQALIERLGPMRLVGTDSSPASLELARAKAATIDELSADYRLADAVPLPLPEGQFTHALMLQPRGRATARRNLAGEAMRALQPGGELALALPLRGSFVEVNDLLREYATRHDDAAVARAIDAAASMRPSPEALAAELEAIGYVDVDVEFVTMTTPFPNGRALFDDPATRILLMPEWRLYLGLDDATAKSAFQYVREAIDRYWAEGGFELTIHVGAAHGRKR